MTLIISVMHPALPYPLLAADKRDCVVDEQGRVLSGLGGQAGGWGPIKDDSRTKVVRCRGGWFAATGPASRAVEGLLRRVADATTDCTDPRATVPLILPELRESAESERLKAFAISDTTKRVVSYQGPGEVKVFDNCFFCGVIYPPSRGDEASQGGPEFGESLRAIPASATAEEVVAAIGVEFARVFGLTEAIGPLVDVASGPRLVTTHFNELPKAAFGEARSGVGDN